LTDKTRRFVLVATVGLALVCGAVYGLGGRKELDASNALRVVHTHDGPDRSNERTPYDPELVNKTIAFWQKQADRDPEGALERRELAGAYLARHRETGDVATAVKAEEFARQSLKILPRNNTAAFISLARGLLAQHRFPEALQVARSAQEYDPHAGRLVADVQIELGDYDAAERSLANSPPEADDLNYYALRARLEAINGKPQVALRLLQQADRIAGDRADMPAETVAWYHTMLGHALIGSGQLSDGEHACRAALNVFPRDYRAMTGMAEAAAWRGDWRGAIEWGMKAVEISPQNPTALKLLGDAYGALGQNTDADRQYHLLKELAHSFPRIYDRNWALFCAENGSDLNEALALARKDLELRRDIHAYDTLAWVYLKKGMLAEAETAMQQSLSRGTREAVLLYHAGMIARAAGDTARAKDYFSRARDINPHSVPLRWLRWLDFKADDASHDEPAVPPSG
jgi:tetratricopeptide (TPR) repeat protein